MKKLTLLLLLPCLLSIVAFSQISQIKIVSFQVKNNLPAKVDDWNTIPGALILTTQKSPTVQLREPKLVLQIKSNGTVICGNSTSNASTLSSFDVKNFTTSELTGMLGNCPPLKEGSYQLCAQFFNLDRIAISNEICKEFKVETSRTIDYSPPTLILPVNSKEFTLDAIKKPLTFSWTPLVPRPKEAVTYKLSVWQLMQGQNGAQALKANQPIITKSVENITQTTVSNLITGPCKPPYLCDFIWNVQALNREGKPVGKNEGMGEPFTFKVTDQTAKMMGGANADFTLDSIYCKGATANGQFIYHIKATYKNLLTSLDSILINDLLVLPAAIWPGNPGGVGLNLFNNVRQKSGVYNNTFSLTPDIVDASTGTIGGVLPVGGPFVPYIIPGAAQSVEFDYIGTGSGTVSFTFYGLVMDSKKAQANRNPRNEELQISQWPQCPCTYCKDDMIQFNGPTQFTDNTTFLTMLQSITLSVPVTQFKAEIIGFAIRPQNNNDECLVCNKNSNTWGNFIGGTLPATFPGMTNGAFPSLPCCGGNGHQTIGWWINTPPPNTVNIVNKNLTLQISLPPRSTLSCCPYVVNFCIRYTFTDAECRSCSVIKCYSYTLNPPKVGHGNPVDISAQAADIPTKQ